MRVLSGIAALCMFVSAYLILVIDRHHERIGDPRRASRRTVMAFRVIGIAGLVLLAWSMDAHARPSPTSGRPSAWCGWWLGQHFGMPARHLWLARNWAKVGSHAGGPGVGVVVVWAHHVGIITGRHGSQWVVKSGNDGRRVRERPRSVARAIAFRRLS